MKKNYSLLVLSIFAAVMAKAAVVYTDINDTTLNQANSSISFDVNNDAINDFDFIRDDWFYTTLACMDTNIVTVSSDRWDDIKALDANAIINKDAGFYAMMDATINAYYGQTFPLGVDKYLGIRILKNGKTYYGWMRVNVAANAVTFKDYAYENTADTQILAGDMGDITKVQNLNSETFNVFPNPCNNILLINKEGSTIEKASIYSIDGKLILQQNLYNGSTTVDISTLNNGVYFLTLTSGNNTKTHKVIKQ